MVLELQSPSGPPRPPTEDELPYDDGEPMESDAHRAQMTLLIATAKEHLGDRAFVGGNLGVYYSDTQAARNEFKAPDFLVVLGGQIRPDRKSWVVWQEGGLMPDVVVELLSDSTAAQDKGPKLRIYERVLRVGQYFHHDLATDELTGWHLVAGRYQRIEADEAGRLPSEAIGLSLGTWYGSFEGLERTWIRWFLDGEPVPTAAERAEAEHERAEGLAQRLARYEARFGGLEAEEP